MLYNNHNLTSVICLYTICSIWPIDRTLSGATTWSQSGLGSNSNEGVLYIPQSSKTGSLPLDGLVSYLRHSLGGSLTPLQRCIRCIYSTAPADWAKFSFCFVSLSDLIWYFIAWKFKYLSLRAHIFAGIYNIHALLMILLKKCIEKILL